MNARKFCRGTTAWVACRCRAAGSVASTTSAPFLRRHGYTRAPRLGSFAFHGFARNALLFCGSRSPRCYSPPAEHHTTHAATACNRFYLLARLRTWTFTTCIRMAGRSHITRCAAALRARITHAGSCETRCALHAGSRCIHCRCRCGAMVLALPLLLLYAAFWMRACVATAWTATRYLVKHHMHACRFTTAGALGLDHVHVLPRWFAHRRARVLRACAHACARSRLYCTALPARHAHAPRFCSTRIPRATSFAFALLRSHATLRRAL